MPTNSERTAPLPPKAKVRRYLFALVLSGMAVYFFLPRFAAMGQPLRSSRILEFHS